jgi:hypothetical protein
MDFGEFAKAYREATYPLGNLGYGVRTRKFFAWFPVFTYAECRWLRRVHVKELWTRKPDLWSDGYYWDIVEFLE